MSFSVHLNEKIKPVIASLPRSHQEKVRDLIDRLIRNPYPLRAKFISLSSTNFDIKKCKGHQTRFRVRLGEYRLIYEVDEAKKRVLTLKLDVRSDVY